MLPFITFLCLSLLLTAPVHSVPLEKRDVVAPPVTAPNSSTIWEVGTTQTVVWDTSNLPPFNQITNQIGEVLLGHLGGGGLNLNLSGPLVQGFNISQGSVNLVVPNVPPRTDYLVVLFGDSGNTSPTFAITGGSNGTAAPSTTSSSTTQSSSSSSSTPTSSSSTGSAQSSATSTPVSSSSPTPTPSTPSPAVITPSGTPSSTTVVVEPTGTSTSTSTKTNGAISMHPIGATCLIVALIIISGHLL
ncbi:hypothetical protein AX14_002553 [Amanita brunnescens Koide BX004]|nr:hypothetical protein AX14_002553 [Amanita brunnescens Koide BX004]